MLMLYRCYAGLPVGGERVDGQWRLVLKCVIAKALDKNQNNDGLLLLKAAVNREENEVPFDRDFRHRQRMERSQFALWHVQRIARVHEVPQHATDLVEFARG